MGRSGDGKTKQFIGMAQGAFGACSLRKFLLFVAPKQQFRIFLDAFGPNDAISPPSNLKNGRVQLLKTSIKLSTIFDITVQN